MDETEVLNKLGSTEYSRTVLVVGNIYNFRDYVKSRDASGLNPYFPACARVIVMDGIRYVHVAQIKETHGYRPDETTYKYVGPHFDKIENILYECMRYEIEG